MLKIAVFAAAFILYLFTLAPDLVWQDQGDFQYQAAVCNLSRPGDLVRVHPLYILTAHAIGRFGPFNYAYAANLTSAIFMALTVLNLYSILFLLSGRIWPSFLGAAVFALAHSVWFLAVQAQTYSMAMAMMSGGLLCALSYIKIGKTRQLYLMGLLFGLGVSVHLMSQIVFAVLMVWLFSRLLMRKLRIGAYLAVIGMWIIGAAALWVAAWIEYRHNGSIAATIRSALIGNWGTAVFNFSVVGLLLKKSILFFALNFPTPLILLSIPGLWLSFKYLNRTTAWLLAISALLCCSFAARYNVRNQDCFFLPFYFLVAIYIGLGFAFLFKRNVISWAIVCSVFLLLILLTYPALAYVAEKHKFDLGVKRHIPYRDAYYYYLVPWQQHQTGPRRLATEVMHVLPPNAFLIPDTTTLPAFQYVHFAEGVRPDVSVLDFSASDRVLDKIRSSGAKVFTISNVPGYYPEWVKNESELKPVPIGDSEVIFEIVTPRT
jgi:hypothetical protein